MDHPLVHMPLISFFSKFASFGFCNSRPAEGRPRPNSYVRGRNVYIEGYFDILQSKVLGYTDNRRDYLREILVKISILQSKVLGVILTIEVII